MPTVALSVVSNCSELTHLNRFRALAHREREIDTRRLLHLQFNAVADDGLETGQFHLYRIETGDQRGKAVDSRLVGDC